MHAVHGQFPFAAFSVHHHRQQAGAVPSRPLSKMRPGACQAGAHLCVMGPNGLPNLLSHSGKEAAAHEGAQGAQRQEHRGRQPAEAGED